MKLKHQLFIPLFFCLHLLIAQTKPSSDSKGRCISGNCIDGIGQFNYINGDTYKGSWKMGKPHGEGTFFYKSEGITYVGEIAMDKFEGFGKLYLPDGRLLYEGQFKNNMMHGRGSLNMLNADWNYLGEFRENKIQGKGIQTFHNGDSIEGHFENGKASGMMIYYDKSSNTKRKAEYSAGELVRFVN